MLPPVVGTTNHPPAAAAGFNSRATGLQMCEPGKLTKPLTDTGGGVRVVTFPPERVIAELPSLSLIKSEAISVVVEISVMAVKAARKMIIA